MHRLLQGDVGAGKAQPLNSLVLTPSGFVPMFKMNIGDTVINPQGEYSKVVGIFPQGMRECFQITFADGTSVQADKDHLWSVYVEENTESSPVKLTLDKTSNLKNSLDKGYDSAYICHPLSKFEHILTTEEIMEIVSKEDSGLTLFNPTPTLSSLHFNTDNIKSPHQTDKVEENGGNELRDGRLLKAYLEGKEYGKPSSLLNFNGEINFFNYQTLERVAFLKGLYEVTKAEPREIHKNHTEACTTVTLSVKLSHTCSYMCKEDCLISQFKHLIALVGGIIRGEEKVGRGTVLTFLLIKKIGELISSSGIRGEGGGEGWDTIWGEKVWGEESFNEVLGKKIIAVESVGFEPMQCIKVSHPNGLYITDGYNVTHNTTVAISALLTSVGSGSQAALMAPTEILAHQLYEEILRASTMLEESVGKKVRVEFFSNQLKGKMREETLQALRAGDIHIAVGTHALLTEDVHFHNLALVVIDEQHRFGVEQRNKLKEKTPNNLTPDTLVMTATPIPRTAIMTVFGDLDVSILKDMPPGRKPVKTVWVDEEPDLTHTTSPVWRKAEEEIQKGHQVFIVCPLVEESETLTITSAVETYETLKTGALKNYSVGLVHGQQKPAEKEETMKKFQNNEINVLVSTTVIEVGVNIPNATLIIILDPNRFGISQLHQLRGRVGRSEHPSYCALYGAGKTPESRERLTALTQTNDGFELSEVDLKLRGHGSIFGTQQSGVSDLKFADIRKNGKTLIKAKTFAENLFLHTNNIDVSNFLTQEHLTQETLQWLNKS